MLSLSWDKLVKTVQDNWLQTPPRNTCLRMMNFNVSSWSNLMTLSSIKCTLAARLNQWSAKTLWTGNFNELPRTSALACKIWKTARDTEVGHPKTLKLSEASHGAPSNLVEIYLDVGPAGSTLFCSVDVVGEHGRTLVVCGAYAILKQGQVGNKGRFWLDRGVGKFMGHRYLENSFLGFDFLEIRIWFWVRFNT
jgi:hypothetical protein